MLNRNTPIVRLCALALGAAFLVSCSGLNIKPAPERMSGKERRETSQPGDKFFGDDALVFGGDKKERDAGGTGIGVNSYLWRASLDTMLFMPVTSADPFGGVIITDWHTPPEANENERFKLNVYILGRELRADGVRVAVFRQVRGAGGDWRDAAIEENTAVKIEDAILMRARQLRHETLEQ